MTLQATAVNQTILFGILATGHCSGKKMRTRDSGRNEKVYLSDRLSTSQFCLCPQPAERLRLVRDRLFPSTGAWLGDCYREWVLFPSFEYPSRVWLLGLQNCFQFQVNWICCIVIAEHSTLHFNERRKTIFNIWFIWNFKLGKFCSRCKLANAPSLSMLPYWATIDDICLKWVVLIRKIS